MVQYTVHCIYTVYFNIIEYLVSSTLIHCIVHCTIHCTVQCMLSDQKLTCINKCTIDQCTYSVYTVYYSGIQCMYSVYTLYTVVYTVLYSGICGGEESIQFTALLA